MIGIGPFITIPLLMSALGGPQAMLGWIVALLIAICDGMVWSELGAAMPGSGGYPAPEIHRFHRDQNPHLQCNLNHAFELQNVRLNKITSGAATTRK